jgi:hypothetical protein
VKSPARDRYLGWLEARVDATPLRRFRAGFALLWLVYDVLDLALGGTARCGNLFAPTSTPVPELASLQAALIAAELLLLWGRFARPLLVLVALLRAAEAYWFLRLNDFYYFSVTALLLALCDCERGDLAAHRWSRDVLRWQTGWIYLATAMMKLSPEFLRGDQLFVRQHYNLVALHWPYPAPYQRCMDSTACNAALSWAGLASELAVGMLVIAGRARGIALALCAGIHLFGALAGNVWFFGPSMFLQVYFLTLAPPPLIGAASSSR